MNKKSKKNNIASIIITLFVIGLLIFFKPASAMNVTVQTNDDINVFTDVKYFL